MTSWYHIYLQWISRKNCNSDTSFQIIPGGPPDLRVRGECVAPCMALACRASQSQAGQARFLMKIAQRRESNRSTTSAFPHFQQMIGRTSVICDHSGHDSASFDSREDDRIASEPSLICICTLIWRNCSFADTLNAHFWPIWFSLLFQPFQTAILIILMLWVHSRSLQNWFDAVNLWILKLSGFQDEM